MVLFRLFCILAVLHYLLRGRKYRLRDRRRVFIRPTQTLIVLNSDGLAALQPKLDGEPAEIVSDDELKFLLHEEDRARLEPELEEKSIGEMQTARSCFVSHQGPGPRVVVDDKSGNGGKLADELVNELGRGTEVDRGEETVRVFETKSRNVVNHGDEEVVVSVDYEDRNGDEEVVRGKKDERIEEDIA